MFTDPQTTPNTSTLKFLGPQWFATVMGLAGLALAWVAAVPRMGEAAEWVARGIGLVAALVFLLLLALFARRGQLHPEAISGDLQHPLRHAFVAALPISLILLAPLAGVALGQPQWAALQFGVGAFLWPVVITLIFVRIGLQGLWPDRLLPSAFITVAPPAVIGLALLPLGAAPAWSQACWGIALFFLLWSANVLRAMLAQPFSMAWWATSFPLAG